MSEPLVCVWDRYTPQGWNGSLDGDLPQEYPVMPLRQALMGKYPGPEYCMTFVIINHEAQPRLTKAGLAPMRDLGLDPRARVIALDIDAPGKDEEKYANATDEWFAANLALLAHSPAMATAGWYRTKGGYRLVWELPEPLGPEKYESVHTALRNEINRVGVRVDHLPDWTRIYRLPFVTRDGVLEDRPYDFTRMGKLPVKELGELPDIKKLAYAPLLNSAWDKDWDEGRNKALMSMAGKIIRAMPDIPQDYLEMFLQTVNENKIEDPLDPGEVAHIAASAMKYKVQAPEPDPETGLVPEPTRRSEVCLAAGQIMRAVDETLEALAARRMTNRIFNQGGRLVRMVRDIEGLLAMEDVPQAALRAAIERVVLFKKYNAKAEEWMPADCPQDLVSIIASKGEFGDTIQELQEILACPTIMPDGTPLTKAGYYPEQAIYLDTEGMDDVDSDMDRGTALSHLRDLVAEFPFEKPTHESVALASFITPVVRSAITGPVPLVLFDASTPSSGKTFLADISSIIATGRVAPRQAQVDEVEFEKRVTSILMNGTRTVLIDNVRRPIGGATMDALLTGDVWVARILGISKMVKLRARVHWMATGNNITIQGDLARRALRCYLRPNVERPEEATNFKYMDILSHVRENRAKYVGAAISLVRQYILAGSPDQGLTALGSFSSWSATVRSALVWAGMPDPVLTQGELRADNATANWGLVLDSLESIYQRQWFSARDVFDLCFRQVNPGGVNRELVNMLASGLEDITPGGREPTSRTISYTFKDWLNRIVENRRLVRSDVKERTKGYIFRIEVVDANTPRPTLLSDLNQVVEYERAN